MELSLEQHQQIADLENNLGFVLLKKQIETKVNSALVDLKNTREDENYYLNIWRGMEKLNLYLEEAITFSKNKIQENFLKEIE